MGFVVSSRGRDDRPGRRPRRRHAVLRPIGLALCFASSFAGCGADEGRVPVHEARGKVIVAGEAPDGALIVLYPAPGASAPDLRPSGRVKPDGTFALTTYDADDGAPAGDYAATIQWNKIIKVGSDFKAGPNIVPAKYAAAETSPWKIKIAAGANELAPLDITK
jgi:major membrane immunogen (membrane-anchored lipoprotein)